MEFVHAPQISVMVYSAMELGIFSKLSEGPLAVEELCEGSSVLPSKLERVMLSLESFNIFSQDQETRKWSHTPRSQEIKQLQDFIYVSISPLAIETYSIALDSLKENKSVMDMMFGTSYFEHIQQDPKLLASFQSKMKFISEMEIPKVMESLNLEGIDSVLDVGGGNGTLMAAVKKKYPHIQVGVLEVPVVIPMIRHTCEAHQVQIEAIEGDFFEQINTGYSCIVMKNIIHDWSDEKSLRILENCRRSLNEGGILFIIGILLEEGMKDEKLCRDIDIRMLLFFEGKERTIEEYRELLEKTGFKLDSYVQNGREGSILKAIAI